MKQWYLLCVCFCGLYLLFPTQNSTLDAWAYAGDIRHGNELFHPHHLLFSATSRLFYPDEPLTVDVLARQKVIHACLAAACLGILGLMLRQLTVDAKHITGYLLIVGSSFGLMRFATDNEVYLWPIFWSLAGTWAFLSYQASPRRVLLLLSGLFMALACLFHQIHAIWWLTLVIACFVQNQKNTLYYILPALLIPCAYVPVLTEYVGLPLTWDNLLHFTLRDFYRGTAEAIPGYQALILTPINFFRTFVQVHGIIFKLLLEKWLYWLPVLAAIILGLSRIRSFSHIQKHSSPIDPIIRNCMLWTFLAHLMLATWAAGNAEFMVMLPFLLVLYIATKWQLPSQLLYSLGLALLIWNLSFGVYPLWRYDYYQDAHMVDFVLSHPDDHYILTERNIINNRLYYRTGKDWNERFTSAYKTEPTLLDSLLQAGITVYSNAIDQPRLFSRAMLTGEVGSSEHAFEAYHLTEVDSIRAFVGKYHIWQLKKSTAIPQK